MKASANGKTENAPYLVILSAASLALIPFGLLVWRFGGVEMSPLEAVLFALLMILTMWRSYADVEYRLNVNYKGYFCYYLIIGLGYCLGSVWFYATKVWPLALIPGELLGLLFVLIRGRVLRTDAPVTRAKLMPIARMAAVLFLSNAMSNLIFNADRMLLKIVLSGTAVTVFYQASLLGKTASLITSPLNSVVIGYLARYNGKLTLKMVNLMSALTAGAIVLGTILCVIASHILIPFLYPQEFAEASKYFVVANLAEVLYFVSGIVTMVLLRFYPVRYQMYVNAVYVGGFGVICIPVTFWTGLSGFCYGLLAVCALRYFSALGLAYGGVLKKSLAEC